MGRLLAGALLLGAAAMSAQAAREDGVYVYDLFRGAPECSELVKRLKALPLRPTVILSVEQGPEFVLDRPAGEKQLACVLNHLKSTSRRAKALLLQDPVFLEKVDEAARRAKRLAEFARRHPGRLAGAQVDVEPHTTEKWPCCSAEERRAVLQSLHRLLARVRRELGRLPLGMVAPWWYPAMASEVPEAGTGQLFQFANEVYLMAYGDEGGPLVGGTAERVLERLNPPELFAGRGRLHVVLATYEFRSPAQIQADIRTLQRRLASRRNFAGTAVFHAGAGFNAPLGRFVSGVVTDSQGAGLDSVEIAAGAAKSKTSQCGQFFLRLDGEAPELVVSKEGFAPKKITLELPPLGAVRELGKIPLSRAGL